MHRREGTVGASTSAGSGHRRVLQDRAPFYKVRGWCRDRVRQGATRAAARGDFQDLSSGRSCAWLVRGAHRRGAAVAPPRWVLAGDTVSGCFGAGGRSGATAGPGRTRFLPAPERHRGGTGGVQREIGHQRLAPRALATAKEGARIRRPRTTLGASRRPRDNDARAVTEEMVNRRRWR